MKTNIFSDELAQ